VQEDADELTGRLVSLQRTGGGGDQWYTIDAETLLVNIAKGTDLPEVCGYAKGRGVCVCIDTCLTRGHRSDACRSIATPSMLHFDFCELNIVCHV
jgi:hypothetical protein